LILLVLKKNKKKLRKIKFTKKKKKLRDQVGNLATFLPINTGLQHTQEKGRAILQSSGNP
jgi:hypothetical protein